jgi:hypothetical protein
MSDTWRWGWAVALALLAGPALAEDQEGSVFFREDNEPRLGVVDPEFATCNQPGFAYNRSCCCTHGWCAPIPSERVRATPEGYEVILRDRREHPKLNLNTRYVIPYDKRGESPDGRYHICGSFSVWCFMAPIGGV